MYLREEKGLSKLVRGILIISTQFLVIIFNYHLLHSSAFFQITQGRENMGKSMKVLLQTQYSSSLNNSVPATFSKAFP